MTKYIAFHNDPEVQSRMLAAVDTHVKQDRVVQGFYGEGSGEKFRGCFIGCTVHAFDGNATDKFNDVDRVFDAYGFPTMLTLLCEQIFEGLPSADAPSFFKAVPNALNLGSDISLVVWKFLHWMAVDTLENYGTDKTRNGCVDKVAVLRDKAEGVEVTSQRAFTTRATGYAVAAADAAADAAYAAAYAAVYADDDAAATAVYHAVYAAVYDAAAASAAASAAAAYAASAAAYQHFAAKLIELIKEAK
jgi:hypothetical protein